MIQEQSLGRHFIGLEIVSQSLSAALLTSRIILTLLKETTGSLEKRWQWRRVTAIMETEKGGYIVENKQEASTKNLGSDCAEKGRGGVNMVLSGRPKI